MTIVELGNLDPIYIYSNILRNMLAEGFCNELDNSVYLTKTIFINHVIIILYMLKSYYHPKNYSELLD